MLLAVQEIPDTDGRFAFTCHGTKGRGLVVAEAANSDLCVGDR